MATLFLMTLLPTSPSMNGIPKQRSIDIEAARADALVIRSHHAIESVSIVDLNEWGAYFVDYAQDGRTATILLRTTRDPLRIVVETTPMAEVDFIEKHELLFGNPCRWKPRD